LAVSGIQTRIFKLKATVTDQHISDLMKNTVNLFTDDLWLLKHNIAKVSFTALNTKTSY